MVGRGRVGDLRERAGVRSGGRAGAGGAELGPVPAVCRAHGRRPQDLWTNGGAQRLTYWVSNDFGALKSRVISETASATHAWESVANVS
jgi:hypothetical protein